MKLQFLKREQQVGGLSLDLLARDLETDRQVIIENQRHWTNHDHLGKAITYAADLDADVVVLVTEYFRPEHKHAFDWLNQTCVDKQYFCVVVEALRISPPDGRFEIADPTIHDRPPSNNPEVTDGPEEFEKSLESISGTDRQKFDLLVDWAKELHGRVGRVRLVSKKSHVNLVKLIPRIRLTEEEEEFELVRVANKAGRPSIELTDNLKKASRDTRKRVEQFFQKPIPKDWNENPLDPFTPEMLNGLIKELTRAYEQANRSEVLGIISRVDSRGGTDGRRS